MPSALHNTAISEAPHGASATIWRLARLYRKLARGLAGRIRVGSEAGSVRLPRRDGCVLHVPRRRRLGDCEPYRAVDPDGAVPVSDRADLPRRLFRLQGT